MARELLVEERIKPSDADPNAAYARALNVATHEIIERWAGGITPGLEPRVENVHLKSPDGTLLGFRLYLVVNESRSLGPTKSEMVE